MVGILFLAHAGVSQPMFWEAWRGRQKIAFVVHANPEVDDRKDAIGQFTKKYGIPLSDRVVPTAWCTTSLVLAMQRGLQYMLMKYPSIQTIYFVSGDDIPIRSAEALLNLPSRTRLCKVDNSILNPIPPSDRKDVFPLLYSSTDFVSHTQFMSLTRKHAEALVTTNLDIFKPMDKYLRDLVDHKEPGTSPTQAERCPDEYIVGSILTHLGFGGEIEKNSCINIAFHPGPTVPTGVVWNDLTTKQPIYLDDEDGETIEQWSLQEAITAAQQDDDVFFLRKVGPAVDLKQITF